MGEILSFGDPHGAERALARVSNHLSNTSLILRDAAKSPLLRMRILSVYSVQPPSMMCATPVVNVLSSLAR
jgi:hypothetical protein